MKRLVCTLLLTSALITNALVPANAGQHVFAPENSTSVYAQNDDSEKPIIIPSSEPSYDIPDEPDWDTEYPVKSPKPSAKPTDDPEPTPTKKPTPTGEPSATVKPTPTPTDELSATVKPTPTPTGEPSATVKPTPTIKPTPTPTEEPSPTVKPTPTPTGEPTAEPSPTATVEPEEDISLDVQLFDADKIFFTAKGDFPAKIKEKGFYYLLSGEEKPKKFKVDSNIVQNSFTALITLERNKSYSAWAYYIDNSGKSRSGKVAEFDTPKTFKWGVDIPTGSDTVRYAYLLNTSAKYYKNNSLPKGYTSASAASSQMTTVKLPVWKLSGGKKVKSTFSIKINKRLAASAEAIFQEIFDLDIKFPVIKLVGYSFRRVGGPGLRGNPLMSAHAFGAAIDINPVQNDYYLGKGNDLRDTKNPYYIPKSVIKIFEKHGWFWGGNFPICADTMHFQYLGLDMLSYHKNPPFQTLKYNSSSPMKGTDVNEFIRRMKALGYDVGSGSFGAKCKAAATKFQKKYGLNANGVVDMATWTKLYNVTHYM